jgi:protease-4
MSKLLSILGSILVLLILLNIAPSLIQNIREEYSQIWEARTKVGRLKISTEINDISFYQRQLERFFKNNAIKAILIELDSQGGAIGSAQALYNEILYLKTEYKKPIVALAYNICTAQAYYIACATDYIITSPSALIGGIGSSMDQFKLEKPEQKKMLQEILDSCYQQFIHDVAYRRGLSITNADQWANGKLFTGTDALKLHLVDEIGSEYNAHQKLKEFALIERDIEWIKPTHPSLWAQLSGQEGAVDCWPTNSGGNKKQYSSFSKSTNGCSAIS